MLASRHTVPPSNRVCQRRSNNSTCNGTTRSTCTSLTAKATSARSPSQVREKLRSWSRTRSFAITNISISSIKKETSRGLRVPAAPKQREPFMPRVNLLVFRETRQRVRGLHLKPALLRVVADFPARPSPESLMAALLRAGELECALADAHDAAARAFSQITDRLAEALLQPESSIDYSALTRNLTEAVVPDEVWVSPPEGFAYYALHPLAFAEVLQKIPTLPGSVLVVGIRSIGTTLSAITTAA